MRNLSKAAKPIKNRFKTIASRYVEFGNEGSLRNALMVYSLLHKLYMLANPKRIIRTHTLCEKMGKRLQAMRNAYLKANIHHPIKAA